MKAWLALAAALLATLPVAACGAGQQAGCGTGAGPHPEIGGEVLFYCSDWPNVNGRIYLLDVATGAERALTSGLAWNLDGAWSPDGTRIAFQSTQDGRDDIYVMNLDGGNARRVTDGRGFNEYPSWSPDGQWIVFNSTRDGVAPASGARGYYRDLYVMRPDGTDVHRVTAHDGTFAFAAWSPDGRTLALQSDRAGTWDLYTISVDGADLRQITRNKTAAGSADFPRWSPDGGRVVFGGSTGGEPGAIYWVTPGDDQVHRVTASVPGLVWDGFPDWSPDGKWIVFERNAEDAQLYAVRPDGSGLTKLTDGRGFKALPRWRPR